MLAAEYQAELRQDVASIIRSNKRLGTGLAAEALVLATGSSASIGHVILTEVKDAAGIELYAMALEPIQHGQRYGGAMLDQVLRAYLPRVGTIFARCLPASTVMYEMLVSRGFEYVFTMRNGARVLRIDAKPA